MGNIFLLIRRFSVLLLFIILQVLSISMLVSYSRSHEARYMEYAYEITGLINARYNTFTRYFSLAENNRLLAEENTRLENALRQSFTHIDTAMELKTTTAMVDSSPVTRKYLWRMARVINNSVSGQNNYITLQRGTKQGIGKDMAVVSAGGIVGIVTDVSDNMSIVMSLLHRKSNTSVALKNSGITGILEWDGANPQRLILRGIPKSAEIKKGDSVLTSNLSLNFPAGLHVGTIAEFKKETGGNNYMIWLKPGANFYTLEYVTVVENLFLKEQLELEQRAKRN